MHKFLAPRGKKKTADTVNQISDTLKDVLKQYAKNYKGMNSVSCFNKCGYLSLN